MGSSHSHHDHEREEHERHVREREERERYEAEEERRRQEEEEEEEESWRRAEEARRQEEAQRREEARRREYESRQRLEEAQRREYESRQRLAEIERRENEARQREEEARRAAEQARRDLEESRRRDEESRQREEEARRREEEARQLAEENKRTAWEAQQREEQAKAHAEEVRRQEEEAKQAAYKALEDEERVKQTLDQTNFYLSKGIQPEVWPTEEEFNLAQARIEYNSEKVHLAICGSSGAGKSSLVNAFRGLANCDAGAAPAGIVETTMAMTRYPDARAEFPYSHFVWFDVPGAGTLDIPGWQYFNKQILFIFDVIILVYDTRFSQIDVAIIQNCHRYRIPLYILRSKADSHIRNVMKDVEPDSDDEDGNVEETYKQARQIFVHSTRGNFEKNVEKAQLTKQDVFIVSSSVMRALVTKKCNSKVSEAVIDEARLLEAISKEAYARLCKDHDIVVKQNMIRDVL